MNEIVNEFLLAGDKFMPAMHLRQLGLTFSVCGPFAKNKEYKNSKKLEIYDKIIKMNYMAFNIYAL